MTPYYIYKQKVLKKGKGKIEREEEKKGKKRKGEKKRKEEKKRRGYQKNKEDIIKEEEKGKRIKR